MKDIAGKSCILTGASRGIGKTLAERLAAEGVLVTAVARDAGLLEKLCSENEGITAHACDVTDEAGVKSLTAEHIERHGGIDILVNNAGIGSFGPIEEVAYQDFLKTMSWYEEKEERRRFFFEHDGDYRYSGGWLKRFFRGALFSRSSTT